MNIVNFVEDTKFGFAKRKCYDGVIKKLASLKINHAANELEINGETSSISMACKFSKVGGGNVLAVANEDGKILIENCLSRCRKTKQLTSWTFTAQNNAVFDMAWCDTDFGLIVGSGDHSVSLWDIGHQSAYPVAVFSEHSKSVRSVCFVPREKYLFASGARDGLILLWDARCSSPNASSIKPYNSIKSYNWHAPGTELCKGRMRKAGTSADSISALLFQNNTTLFSCSVGEGTIKVWDTRKCYSAYKRVPQPVHMLAHPIDNTSKTCFTSLALDPNGVKLYANAMDNTIYCYNVSTYSRDPVATYTGHEVNSFYIRCCLSPDGRYLLSGSSDNKAYIWRTDKPSKPIVFLGGHRSEVTCVDWSSSPNIQLATCSDDLPPDSESVVAMIWEVMSDDCRSMVFYDDAASSHLQLIGLAEEIVDKSSICHKKIITPRRSKIIEPTNEDHPSPSSLFNSPTSNLPNYVIDGTSPHHQCTVSRQKENRNWLIEFKNKTPPAQNARSPRTGQKRPRQHNPKVCGNLLKFFKVSSKQNTLTPSNQISNNNMNNSSSSEC